MTGQPTTTDAVVPQASAQATEPPSNVEPAELVLEDRFSMVPEWVLDAEIGDCALRLYAVLLRYGNTTGARMPARTTLAARLHKKSVDTVDRALAELVQLGAVQVQHRWDGRQRLTNQYRIRTSGPQGTRVHQRRGPLLSPTGVAARIRQGWPHGCGPTEKFLPRYHHPPPPPSAGRRGTRRAQRTATTGHWRARRAQLLADCGISDDAAWADYVGQVHRARRIVGQPLTRWASAHLVTALDLAISGRGWPPDRAARAVLQVAADPTTRSPARVAEAGPWWSQSRPPTPLRALTWPRSKPNLTPSTASGFSYSSGPANN